MAKKATNSKSPWRKSSNSKKARGDIYETPSEDHLRRGKTRRAIEDKQLERELNDDPLFGG